MFRSLFKTIKPSHGYLDEAREEDFAHQGLILEIDDHSLIKMAYMFDKVGLAIINGKSRIVEATRELGLLDTLRKRGMRYLEESFSHGIISLASPWWGLRPPMIMFSSRGMV